MRKNIDALKDESRGITPARDYILMSGSGAAALLLVSWLHRRRVKWEHEWVSGWLAGRRVEG